MSAEEEEELLYWTRLPRAPGGGTCVSIECGGPGYCVHRHLAPIARSAIAHWRAFDAPWPGAAGSNVRAASAAVAALLEARVHPRDWRRCGADAERLSALGYDIDVVVRHYGFLLEDVLAGLGVDDWTAVRAFGFDASMLADRDHFPVVVLAAPPLRTSARELLRCTSVSYETLVDEYGLTHEELLVLGFSAPLLVALGMRGEHVFAALAHPHVRARGTAWWARALGFTAPLAAKLLPPYSTLASEQDRAAYLELRTALIESR